MSPSARVWQRYQPCASQLSRSQQALPTTSMGYFREASPPVDLRSELLWRFRMNATSPENAPLHLRGIPGKSDLVKKGAWDHLHLL